VYAYIDISHGLKDLHVLWEHGYETHKYAYACTCLYMEAFMYMNILYIYVYIT
jgi:hypothetical protein